MDISWRKRMIEILRDRVTTPVKEDVTIMDVATGTADVALMIGAMIPNAKVIGVDPSQNMIDIGTTKIAKQNLSNRITLHLGDSRFLHNNIAYSNDNTFDGATMAFGIRNVPKPRELALCEIHRVLRHNAPFCILEFSEPTGTGILEVGAKIF